MNKLNPSKTNQELSLSYGVDLYSLGKWGIWQKKKSYLQCKNSWNNRLHASLTWICNISLGVFLKEKHRYLFSKEAFCLHFIALDAKYLLAGRSRVGINWSSGEGELMAFKYSLPVSWLSQKCSFGNLLTRCFAGIRIFFSVQIHTYKSCLTTRMLFCLQQSMCVVKACHRQNKTLSGLFPVGAFWEADLEMQTDFCHLKSFHWKVWSFPSHPPNSLYQQFATIAPLPQWDETKFIL